MSGISDKLENMRTDRLLQLVTLLRRHERMSAAELARRLEVTPRTIMRDVDALSLAGVPVYAERGRTGGYALLPGYTPDTESLQPDEARALFVAGGSAVADALGMGQDFERALRKLATGLPSEQTREVGQVLQRLVVDPSGWGRDPSPRPTAMATVVEAVQADRRLRLSYRSRGAGQPKLRTVDPWGLVLAGATWYLIAAHRGVPHTYRVDRMEQAVELDEPTHRPAGLDLLAVWHELRAAWQDQPTHTVRLRILRGQRDLALRLLEMVLMAEPAVSDDGEEHSLIVAEVSSLRGVVGVILGFGSWVEALEPPELRGIMVSVAEEARAMYREAPE